MRVTANDLDEIVLAFDQRLIIDTAGVHLAETVFAALGDESTAVTGVFIVESFLVFIAHGGTVDNDAGSLNGFFGFEGRFHSHVGKLMPAVFVDTELGAFTPQHMDFRTIGDQGRALVERDFVESRTASRNVERIPISGSPMVPVPTTWTIFF